MPPLNGAALPEALAPGLYVQVVEGMVNMTNTAGSQNFTAGQFGYTPNVQQAPVILPANPGMKFAPPPAFSSSSVPQGGTAGSPQSAAVNCEVR